jgi:ABC-2 type transport system ATP-binding protein
MGLIRFLNVSKSFGTRKVIDNLTLEIDKGDVFGLLGPSGSGKSTLIKILLGMHVPDKGTVFFNDEDITGNSEKLKRIVGLTTQENAFYEKLTVFEKMQYYAGLYGIRPVRHDIMKILDSVKLEHAKDTLAGNISGGMKRRLDFAISLLHDPELLILDEPTTGLDPLLVEQFWHIVSDIRKRGKTILVISHIFSEIQENCNRIGILNKGRMTELKLEKHTDLMKRFKAIVNE